MIATQRIAAPRRILLGALTACICVLRDPSPRDFAAQVGAGIRQTPDLRMTTALAGRSQPWTAAQDTTRRRTAPRSAPAIRATHHPSSVQGRRTCQRERASYREVEPDSASAIRPRLPAD